MTSIGVLAVGRPTFDLDWARARATTALDALRRSGIGEVLGEIEPVTDPSDVAGAVARWGAVPDRVVLLQATFTDSRFALELAAATDAELAIWAFPEHREGGRLRLNSLCGLVLASFSLATTNRPLRWIYLDPEAADAADRVREWLAAPAPVRPPVAPVGHVAPDADGTAVAHGIVERLRTTRVGVVGDPPPGFGPCDVPECARHTPAEDGRGLDALGIDVARTDLAGVLRRAGDRTDSPAQGDGPPGVDDLDAAAVSASFRLRRELQRLAATSDWDALAVRCWPEPFEELGCAACHAFARLNEIGLPVSCEADALGAVTMLVLGWLGESRPFLADLVDVDPGDDTAAVWHCGVAPADVAAAGTLHAGVHPNRGMPLVQELALKPGRATVARFSLSRGVLRLVLGGVDVLDAAGPYQGSGGVVRFDRPVGEVLRTIVDEGLDHHLALVYGDVCGPLRAIADELGLPVVEL
jgi:hypothetical protein